MEYKKIKSISIVIVTIIYSLLFFTSCDEFLAPKATSFTSADQFFQAPEEFEIALNGAYDRLRAQAPISNNQSLYMLEIRADNINRQFNINLPGGDGQGQEMEEWIMRATNAWIQAKWTQIYSTISQTNSILQRIDEVEFSNETQKNRIKGEAKFIRALSYWFAVQFWGDLPILLEEVNTPGEAIPAEGRNPKSEVFDQIIKDLQEAISELPAVASQPGRATEGAAKFLLGKTFMLIEDYSSAITLLESVESDYGYSLVSDYEDIWNPNNTNNSESIFEFQFSAEIAGQPHANMIAKILPHNSRGEIVTQQVNPLGWYHPSIDLVEMFEENDQRFEANIDFWEKPGNSEFPDVAFYGDSIAIINKFFWPEYVNDQGQQEGNIIMFRYADALLSLAEAYWRDDPAGNQGNILSLLNRIRDRAGLPNLDLNNVPMHRVLEGTFLENDPLGRAIFIERTIELFAEGHRLLDLKRFGDEFALTVLTNYTDRRKEREPRVRDVMNIQQHKLLFPIPIGEVDLAGLEQNPGW